MFHIIREDGAARLGRLVTRSGSVSTPFFMPVITTGPLDRSIGPPDYHGLGAGAEQCSAGGTSAAIANSLIAAFAPGVNPIRQAGGLRNWLATPAVLFTDSGGYQTSQGSSFFVERHEAGCKFRARWSHDVVELTPRSSIDLQHALGSDVAMVLDDMTPYGGGAADLAASVERSHRWAQEAVAHRSDSAQLLFAICHGGTNAALRRYSATVIDSLDVDGVAIGGIGILPSSRERLAAVDHSVQWISAGRPRYAMGVGHPPDIVDLVLRGIDCFDAAYPSIEATRGRLVTWSGLRDFVAPAPPSAHGDAPIDAQCDCSLCGNLTSGAFRELARTNRLEASRLATVHNLAFFVRLMNRIQRAINDHRLTSFALSLRADWARTPLVPL